MLLLSGDHYFILSCFICSLVEETPGCRGANSVDPTQEDVVSRRRVSVSVGI